MDKIKKSGMEIPKILEFINMLEKYIEDLKNGINLVSLTVSITHCLQKAPENTGVFGCL